MKQECLEAKPMDTSIHPNFKFDKAWDPDVSCSDADCAEDLTWPKLRRKLWLWDHQSYGSHDMWEFVVKPFFNKKEVRVTVLRENVSG